MLLIKWLNKSWIFVLEPRKGLSYFYNMKQLKNLDSKDIEILMKALNEVSLDTFEEKHKRDFLLYSLNGL